MVAASDRPFAYAEFAPGESVRDVALTYWRFFVRELPSPDFVHRVWPDGCVTVTFVAFEQRAIGAYVLGVRQSAFDVPVFAGARYWGVRFRPESGAAFLGVTPAVIREQNLPAATLLGDEIMRTTESIARGDDEAVVRDVLDAWILSRAMPDHAIDPTVRDAAAVIAATGGQRAIADVARDVGVSPRVLQRKFLASVGISPKAFAVLRRGRHVLKHVVTHGAGADVGGWSGVALAGGYADQAHFTREIARLTRFAPTALQQRLETIAHERLQD